MRKAHSKPQTSNQCTSEHTPTAVPPRYNTPTSTPAAHPHSASSDELCNIHGHLVDLCAVELLDVPQDLDVIRLDKVDGHTLAPEAAAAPDAVDVQLTVVGQVVVDHQGHLVGDKQRKGEGNSAGQ